MPAPTQPVTVKLADFGGPAVAGVTVTARLSQVDYTADGTFVSTEPVTGETDVNGQVILQLFPCALAPTGLGTVGAVVRVTAPIPYSQPLDVLAVIPNVPCNLASVQVVQAPTALSDIQVAVRAAIDNRLYPNTYAVAPLTRPDGSPRQAGDRYLDPTYLEYRWTGAAWVSIEANAAASATAAAASAAAAATSKTGADTARDAAIAAAATAGIYPNTAALNVPRGLTQASVGAITPGAGGTNGTFALGWAGGNFLFNPTGTFTVAGGVLTAVTITGPGLYIGAAPAVPAPSFAASAGLAGAAVVLTAQFLVEAGKGYWVQSSDGLQIDRYNNVGGVATLDASVKALPTVEVIRGVVGSAVHGVLQDVNGLGLGYWKDDGFYYIDPTSGTYKKLSPYPSELETPVGTPLAAVRESRGRDMLVVDEEAQMWMHGKGRVFDSVMSNSVYWAQVYASFGDNAKASYFWDKAKHELGRRVHIQKSLIAHNADGTSFARFPCYVPITNTTGVLFFAQRWGGTNNGEDFQRLVCCDVTFDATTLIPSVSARRVIDQPATWATGAGGYATGPAAVRDPVTGHIHLLYNRMLGDGVLANPWEIAVYYTKSTDNGATWSVPLKIMGKEQIYQVLGAPAGGVPTGVPGQNGVNLGTGNSFLRIPSGPYAGRMVTSFYSVEGYYGAFWSDNNGVNWTRGTLHAPVAGKNYNENAIAYCSDGSLVMLHRCDNFAGTDLLFPGVGVSRSTDGGATWTYVEHEASAGFGNSSIALVNASIAASTGFEKLIAADTVDTTYYGRLEFELRLSYDKGATWVAKAKFFPDMQGVGYSHFSRASDGDYQLFYETFKGEGNINVEDSIGVLRINEAELFANAVLI